jgi:hypothetical protein
MAWSPVQPSFNVSPMASQPLGKARKKEDKSEKVAGNVLGEIPPEDKSAPISASTRPAGPAVKTENVFKKVEKEKTKIRETFLPQKLAGIKNLGAAFLGLSQGVLGAALMGLKAIPRSASSMEAMKGVGFAFGGLQAVLAFQSIAFAVLDSAAEIKSLRARGEATPKRVAKVIFRQFFVDKPVLRDVASLALGVVSLTKMVGTFFTPLPQTVMNSLSVAASYLGCAAGALTVLFGAVQTGLGIRDALRANSKVKAADARVKELESSSAEKTDPIHNLKKQVLQISLKNAKKERTQGILRACLGCFISASGVCGVAALFTGGWAAVGIVAAGIVLGSIALGVAIGSKVYQMRSDKKIRAEVNTLLGSNEMTEALKTDEGWKGIVKELKLSPVENENITVDQRKATLMAYYEALIKGSVKEVSLGAGISYNVF